MYIRSMQVWQQWWMCITINLLVWPMHWYVIIGHKNVNYFLSNYLMYTETKWLIYDVSLGAKFDTTNLGSYCRDEKKENLDSISECKEAAQELGKSFSTENTLNNYPMGCFFDINNRVYWRTTETGEKNYVITAICRKQSKYIPTYH